MLQLYYKVSTFRNDRFPRLVSTITLTLKNFHGNSFLSTDANKTSKFSPTSRKSTLASPSAYSDFTIRIQIYNPASLCIFKNL